MLQRAFLALAFVLLANTVTPPAIAGPDDWAIVVGNKTYKHGVPIVEFATNDANAFAKAAVDVFKVPQSNIIERHDATFGDFLALFGGQTGEPGQLDRLPLQPSSNLYIFVSAHGVPVIKNGRPTPYLLPVDASPDSARSIGVSLEELIRKVDRIMKASAPRGRAIIVVDACFSGMSGGGPVLPKDTSAGSIPVELARDAGTANVIVMSAASDSQVAHWDRHRKHGMFTDALLFGLYGAADTSARADKRVTVGELKSFVERRIRARLAMLHRGSSYAQTPTFRASADTIEIVSYGGPLPERDPVARRREELSCKRLEQFGTGAEIDAFLTGCAYCACAARLEAKKAAMSSAPNDCEGERMEWDDIRRRGRIDVMEYFAQQARCDEIKREVAAAIDTARGKGAAEKSRAEAEARRITEAQRRKEEADKSLADRAALDRDKLAQEQMRLDIERRRLEMERAELDRRRSAPPPIAPIPPAPLAPAPLDPIVSWRIDRQAGRAIEGDGDDPDVSGTTYESCAQRCLDDSRCMHFEFYAGPHYYPNGKKGPNVVKCNIKFSERVQYGAPPDRRATSIVGIKRRN